MNVMPLPLADRPEISTTPPPFYAGKDDRITGWRLLTIWTVGFVWSWSLFIAIAVGLARLAEFLAGL